MKSTVTSRGQTVVPVKIRLTYGIEPQSRLEWIDDGSSIRVVPLPEDPVGSLRGSSSGLTDLLLTERERERQREAQPPAHADAALDD
jgi:bifunctional DNA-binding transcriptional regulator/antitoxin component of YhaV-PrlF toxin-antitoxin module